MPDLVALALPGGPAFVEALQRVWEAGDVALPLDRRLPAAAAEDLLDRLGATSVVADDPAERIARPLAAVAADLPPLEDGDAIVVATSGTTGRAKGVVHTHASIHVHARAVHDHLDVVPERDRWLACLPLGHVGGLGVVLRSMVTGTPVDVLPGFDAALVDAAPSTLGSTLVSLVPTALDRVDPGRWRWVVLGGSGDPRRAERPANVVPTYGSTETGGGIVYGGDPLPDARVRIADDGTIEVAGPMLLRCYRDGTDPRVDGWLRTGDAGAVGPDGRLSVHGRVDDVIVTGGENVWPDAVERVLATAPGVAEVAVAGRPDPEWGQQVVAWVVPEAGAVPSLDEVRAHAKDHLPPWAAPRSLVLVDALPRTPLGKVRRAVLP